MKITGLSCLDSKLSWSLTLIERAKTGELLGDPSWHQQRRLAHTASLLALSDLLDDSAFPCSEIDYYRLADRPILVSRSHGEHYAAACILNQHSSGPGILSIGIDIEPQARQIKEGIEKFFIRSEDRVDSSLLNWCAKEAAFKALSSYLRFHHQLPTKPLTLKDLLIEQLPGQETACFRGAPELALDLNGRIHWILWQDQLLALAVLDHLNLEV